MIRNPTEKNVSTKQEGDGDNSKAPTTSSTQWSGLRNPRIVRVTRALGGKDRHSKVSTVRGLRDRRVRLSVPTAIQLYDLQYRLGVSQPSKVVDWLLKAAHQEINKLPPLQGNFIQIPQSSLPPLVVKNINYANEHEPHLDKENTDEGMSTFPQSTHWSPKHRDDQLNGTSVDPSLASVAPYASYHHWEVTNAYLSQFGIRPLQIDAPLSMLPSYFSSSSADFDAKQFIHMQTVSSASTRALQSNSAKNSLHFGGPSVSPFQ